MIKLLKLTFCFTLATAVCLLNISLIHADSDDAVSQSLDQIFALQNDTRVPKLSTELLVNPDISHRVVVPNKCEKPGEKELKRLAGMSDMEESYVLIPSLCIWLETGHSETHKTVRLDAAFIEELLRHHSSIVIYHIHVGTSDDISEYFPAYSDMISLVLMNAKFFTDPNIEIVHRAMTSLGVIDYSFIVTQDTERLLAKLRHTGLGDFVAQNIAYEFSRDAHRRNYYSALQDCIDSYDSPSNKLVDCFPMRADDFVLQYRPVAD